MIRRYVDGDVFFIDVQEQQRHEFDMAVKSFDQVGKFSLINGESGEVLAVFGYDINHRFVAECFALLSKNIGRKILQLVRFLKKCIPIIMKENNINCAIMTVKCDFIQAKKMARMLEFTAGDILPQFFCGFDYQVFERRKNVYLCNDCGRS